MQATHGAYYRLYVRDPQASSGDLWRVGGLRQTALTTSLGALAAAGPSAYSGEYSVPGQGSWQVRSSGLRVYATAGGEPGAGYQELEKAQRERRYAQVVLEEPNGSTREGMCIVTQLTVNGSYDDALKSSISLKGVGNLD